MKMGFFSKFIKSIVDAKAYKYFYDERKVRTIGYLLLICLIFTSFISVKTVYSVNKGLAQFEKYFESQVPDFTLSDGKLNVHPDKRVVLGDPDDYPVIIDTTDTASIDELDNYNEGILILKDRIINKENPVKKSEFGFSALGGTVLNKSDVQAWIPLLKWINVIIVIVLFISFTIGKLISALILAIIGMIINSIIKTNYPFGKLYKLAIYALTLPIILNVIEILLGVNIPRFAIIYYGIGAVYMWRGMNAIKPEDYGQIEN